MHQRCREHLLIYHGSDFRPLIVCPGSWTTTEFWEYPTDNIMILRDDSEDPDLLPTKANIVSITCHQRRWLCPDHELCVAVCDGVARR